MFKRSTGVSNFERLHLKLFTTTPLFQCMFSLSKLPILCNILCFVYILIKHSVKKLSYWSPIEDFLGLFSALQ